MSGGVMISGQWRPSGPTQPCSGRQKMITGSLVLRYLTHTAGREPEHVLHQSVSVGVEGDQLLLDELLGTLGGEPQGDGAETAAVVRTGNNARC